MRLLKHFEVEVDELTYNAMEFVIHISYKNGWPT